MMNWDKMQSEYIYGCNLNRSELDEYPVEIIQGEIDVLKMKNSMEVTHYYGDTALSRPNTSEKLQTESIILLQEHLIRRAAKEKSAKIEGATGKGGSTTQKESGVPNESPKV